MDGGGDEGRGWKRLNRVRDGRRVGRAEGEGEIRSTFWLDKSLPIQKDKKKTIKMCAFEDLSAPPLVQASDIKICSCCRGIEILSDSSAFTSKYKKCELCGEPLRHSYRRPLQAKRTLDWGCFCGVSITTVQHFLLLSHDFRKMQ